MADDLVAEFLVECEEALDLLDDALLAIEQAPDDADALAAAFRSMHSLKGAAGFMEAPVLEAVAHAAENVLGAIREGRVVPTPAHGAVLLDATEALHAIVDGLREGKPQDLSEYRSILDDLAASIADPVEGSGASEEPETVGAVTFLTPPPRRGKAGAEASSGPEPDAVEVPEPSPAEAAPQPSRAGASRPASSEVGTPQPAKRPESTVRVGVDLLDEIMNLVGELVVCRNQILRLQEDGVSSGAPAVFHRLDQLTSGLQAATMKTRMRPLASAWRRLPRIVRDLGVTCGKRVRLVMDGQDVELDRSIIERIGDPLVHMLRNAVDHGIEAPEVRRAAGKPEVGTISLSARHIGGAVHILLEDDGAGIDCDRVLAKAVANGVVDPDRAESLTREEILDLVFEPGLSTAKEITRTSGRGVGMDVVRAELSRIGGSVELSSTVGEGTTIRLRIPLTLAILPALMVSVRDRVFAIPQSHLIEIIDVTFGEKDVLENLGGALVLRRGGDLLPVLDLATELGLPGEGSPEFVVVVQADERAFAMAVDGIDKTEEIVVKPLGPELDGFTCFAGATVRGEGSIAPILDVGMLSRTAHQEALPSRDDVPPEEEAPTETVLRFHVEGVGPAAIPVSQVRRIHDVPAARLERHGTRRFLVVDGRVVPVLELAPVSEDGETLVPVIVCDGPDGVVAVVVSAVQDVVDAPLDVTPGVGAHWARGMCLVEGATTSLLDLSVGGVA